MSMTKTIPVCEGCRGAAHFGGEPDFPWHPAAKGDACGVADHDEINADDTADCDRCHEPDAPFDEVAGGYLCECCAREGQAVDEDVDYGDPHDRENDDHEVERDSEADHGYADEYMNRRRD